jgi:hypothetical protein
MDFVVNAQSLKPISGIIPSVSTRLNWQDYCGAIKVRWGIGRNHYTVDPGLYKVGNPDSQSDVYISANYKLSFDILRKNLDSFNAWILVINTKGINVWCAAGKGTFGTDNIVNSIKETDLANIVKHRNLIVPQLGAVGVAAHKIKEQSGFRVIYGPIRAKDIKAFVQAGYKASQEMRKVTFPLGERAKLIPVDMMGERYKLLLSMLILFVFSGLDRKGFLFSKMIETSIFPLISIVSAYFAGIIFTPLFLPLIPFRSFALKGAIWGALSAVVSSLFFHASLYETIALGFLSMSVASFMAMNFTGSSTYTSLSGVKKEMKWAIPLQITFAGISIILFIISKLF